MSKLENPGRRNIIKGLVGLPFVGAIWGGAIVKSEKDKGLKKEILRELKIEVDTPSPYGAMTGDPIRIGIIGGTGLYELPGFDNAQWINVDSVFGKPSDQLLIGEFKGQRLVFLPRHGRGHRIPPTEINYRANIEAMKRVGVTRIISFSAVGSNTAPERICAPTRSLRWGR